MVASTIALAILSPFVAVFGYATWHEYRRYKEDGPSHYGLTYDPETNTTVVGPIPEGEESFDPEDFEPDLPEIEAAEENQTEDGADTATETDEDGADTAPDTDHADTDADTSDKDRAT